jgi:hypothetical protein
VEGDSVCFLLTCDQLELLWTRQFTKVRQFSGCCVWHGC